MDLLDQSLPRDSKAEEREAEAAILQGPKAQARVRSALVKLYRQRRDQVEAFKAKVFYHGTPVWVNAPRYVGPGLAVSDHQAPPDQVAVALPNGNTWRYDIEHVQPQDCAEELKGSATWEAVFKFALAMEAKLAANRHKGDREGWLSLDIMKLWSFLMKEVGELEAAVAFGDPNAVREEAADVANFAMMVADKKAMGRD